MLETTLIALASLWVAYKLIDNCVVRYERVHCPVIDMDHFPPLPGARPKSIEAHDLYLVEIPIGGHNEVIAVDAHTYADIKEKRTVTLDVALGILSGRLVMYFN